MQKHVLVLVFNQYEKLNKLLAALNNAGIKGATVINSAGMAQVLINNETDTFLGSLRTVLSPDREDNRTVFIVLDEDMINTARKVIHDVIGALDKPGAGILFVVPVSYYEGINS
jgi:nitrogen regulatory protein PII